MSALKDWPYKFCVTILQLTGFYSHEMQGYAIDQNIFHLFDWNLWGRGEMAN